MAGYAIKDFSGGMISDISDLLSPENGVKSAENVDLWSEPGAVKLLNNIKLKTAFPSGKVYDTHVTFPAQGDKDYIIFLMTDGSIYSYDGTSFASIGSVTVGSKMVYAGDRIYIFYRDMASPTLGNTSRKAIEYDYSAGTFSLVDVVVENRLSIDSATQSLNVDDGSPVWIRMVITSVLADGSESSGIEHRKVLSSGGPLTYLITRDADLVDTKVYIGFAFDTDSDGVKDTQYLTPQLLHVLNKDGDKSFVSFAIEENNSLIGGDCITQDNTIPGIRVWSKKGGTFLGHPLKDICSDFVSSSLLYINTGNKVKIAGNLYTIQTITHNSVDPNNQWYEIELDSAPDPSIESGDFIDIELGWHLNKFKFPISKLHQFSLFTQVDENRPESDFTAGTGDLIAYAKNRLFVANPYFPDIYSTGKTEDKKGWIAWSYITGEGKYALALIPDTQMFSTTFTGGVMVDIVGFQDTLFILQKEGISRFILNNNQINLLQSDRFGLDNDKNYYVDLGNMFIFSNNRLIAAAIEKLNYETGGLNFADLSTQVRSQLSGNVDARIFYDNRNDLVFLHDINGNISNFICSLRLNKPVWVKYNNGASVVVSGFKLSGSTYFIVKTGSTYSIYDYDTVKIQNMSIEDKDRYLPLEQSFVRQVEVLYVKTSGTLTFDLYLDGVSVKSENLPDKTSVGFYKVRLPRTSKTRFDKVKWKLTGTNLSSDFKLLGIFINRGDYGKEFARGY